MGSTAQARAAFPLRLRSERRRALLREVAEREHLSQNELIEQAIEHELVARGAMLADDLATSARRLAALTAPERSELIERSVADAGRSEHLADPIRVRGFRVPTSPPDDRFGVLAAFESARR